MKLLRKMLWRYWKRLDAGRRFREARRKAGLCFQCGDPRQPHALRCRGCTEANNVARHLREAEGAAADMPKFWRENPELVENNDRVLQAAWEAEHACCGKMGLEEAMSHVHVDLVLNCDACPFSWLQRNEMFRCVHDFVTRPELKEKGFFFSETGRRIYLADEPTGGCEGRPKWCPLEAGDVLVTIRKP